MLMLVRGPCAEAASSPATIYTYVEKRLAPEGRHPAPAALRGRQEAGGRPSPVRRTPSARPAEGCPPWAAGYRGARARRMATPRGRTKASPRLRGRLVRRPGTRSGREPARWKAADARAGRRIDTHPRVAAEAAVACCLPDPDLVAALEALPERARLLIVLADISGLSYQEIADLTGTAAPAVGMRLHRGRRRLRRLLARRARSGHQPGRAARGGQSAAPARSRACRARSGL